VSTQHSGGVFVRGYRAAGPRLVLGVALSLVLLAAAIAAAAILHAPLERAIGAVSPGHLATFTATAILSAIAVTLALVRARRVLDRASARELRTLRETTLLLQDRAGELEMLMRLAESLGQALDPDSLKSVIVDHLQPLVAGHDLWLSTKESGWEPVVGSRPIEDRLSGLPPRPATWHTFPLISQQKLVGVLGVRHDNQPLTQPKRELLQAAAALLTVAVKNVQLFRTVRDLAVIEPMTGCVTRHHGIERLGAELRRAQRSHMPVAVVMLDLDHFKAVNDHHGHLCGDQVLAGVGRILRETLRMSDERCRYGGEEFLVVLPDTTMEGAARVAENLRARFAATPILCARGAVRFTASFGVTQALPGEGDVNSVLGRADAALYAAKAAGRNRVCSHTATGAAGALQSDGPEAVQLVERRDARRADRRLVGAGGRRASDLQQRH
jgi:diguanylate cyclase (GGDEF)-like protein